MQGRKLVPTSVAAAALGVQPATVRKLRERGLLRRYGSKTKALYDLAECERLMLRVDRHEWP